MAIQFNQEVKDYELWYKDYGYVKGYEFLLFAKYIGKYISKNVSSKYSPKILDHAKQSVTDAFKFSSEKSIQNQRKQRVI